MRAGKWLISSPFFVECHFRAEKDAISRAERAKCNFCAGFGLFSRAENIRRQVLSRNCGAGRDILTVGGDLCGCREEKIIFICTFVPL